MSGLATIAQNDFAVGVLRGVAQDVQPGVGLFTISNGLLDDDGDIYLRGGCARESAATTGYPGTFLWSGVLGGQQITVYSSGAGLGTLIGDAPTVLDPFPLLGPTRGAVVGERLFLPHGRYFTTLGGSTAVDTWVLPPGLPVGETVVVATIAGRLVVASGNRIAFSDPLDTTDATLPPVFQPTDYHVLPGGVSVRGLYAIQDTLLAFTDYGLWSIANMAYDLTDANANVQHTVALLSPDLSLINDAGLCGWQGRVVAPCRDRVYLVDLSGPPQPVSDSITPLYTELMDLGCIFGGAKVFRNTLFLPVINVPSGVVRTTLTCRLSRPIRGRQLYFPWTELAGYGAQHVFFDFFASGRLLAMHADGFINDVTWFFNSGGDDADGTVPVFEVETRDFPTGNGQPNHLKRVRMRYSLLGAGVMQLSYSSDPQHEVWTALPHGVMVDQGTEPLAWWLPVPARVRYVRLRLRLIGAPDHFVLHNVELHVRQATHAR